MSKPIEVLWIDDESKKDEYKIYYIESNEHGINLNSFQYEEEGLAELDDNFSHYDAILVDVITQKYEGSAQMENHRYVYDKIKTIFNKKRQDLPIFIFTGKSGIGEGADHVKELYKNSKEMFFVKNKDDNSLWKGIRNKVSNEKRNQIKERYKKVLNCAELNNDKIYSRVLTLVYHIEGYLPIDKPWSEMRGVLEDLIIQLVATKNCHERLINNENGTPTLGYVEYYFQNKLYIPPPKKDPSTNQLVYNKENKLSSEDIWDDYIIDIYSDIRPIINALNHSNSNKSAKKTNWESQRENKNLQRSVVYRLFMLVEYIANRYYKNS